jgi:anthranilate phosphoribosyltransferase
MDQAVNSMMQGEWSHQQVAVFLTALHTRGETVDEVVGAASAMRSNMTAIQSRRDDLIDTCGTGGDGSATFNISTAAAFVVAGAGRPVAKHGNRSITSKTGSADVLAELGVCIDPPVSIVERCLEQVGICFCFAPMLHPAMKHVAPVRKELEFPTIFNLLGPLCNPAGAPFQLLGVGKQELRPLLAEALSGLGTERAIIVTGADGLDEVTLTGPTDVLMITEGQISEFQWTPEEFDIARHDLESMRVENAEQSAEVVRRVLSGEPGPARDIVILNAAAALWVADPDLTLPTCRTLAAEAIDTGAAAEKVERLKELTAV